MAKVKEIVGDVPGSPRTAARRTGSHASSGRTGARPGAGPTTTR